MQILKTVVSYQGIRNYQYFYESINTSYYIKRDKTSFSTAEILYRSESYSTSRIVLLILYRVFHEILFIIFIFHQAVIKTSIKQKLISQRILNNLKYVSYFKNYVDTLDSIYIDIYVFGEFNVPYRNCKKTFIQNVLVVCDFELQFRYILAGWGDSAYNIRILRNTVSELKAPLEKYYLNNTEYTNSE